MVGSRRQGWAIFAAMVVLFVVGVAVVYAAEQHGTPAQHAAGVSTDALRRLDRRQPGGQGAALRDRRLGAVDRGHDRHLVRRGQRGVRVADRPRRRRAVREPRRPARSSSAASAPGLYSMLLFVLLAVFIGGLMVGRTPEYLGKKIEAREIKLVIARRRCSRRWSVLVTTRSRSATKYGAPSICRVRPAGLLRDPLRLHVAGQQQRLGVRRLHRLRPAQRPATSAPTAITLRRPARRPDDAVRALRRRSSSCSPSPARWSASGSRPPGLGTMRTDTPTFVVLLIGVIVLVGALTFFPALLLGPVVQGLTTRLF